VNLFSLTQYEKLLYLDADTLPIQEISHLLDRPINESQILAAPDCGWPDIFNSGVFMIKPSVENYDALLNIVRTSEKPSFDGADQGLLNEFFTVSGDREWIRLPFTYNVTPSGGYEYLPAFKFFSNDVKLIHYIGSTKPWDCEPWDNVAMRDRWWSKYTEFFGAKPILEAIRGIVPYYFEPMESEPVEEIVEPEYVEPEELHEEYHGDEARYEEINDVLLNPQSYQYFETVQAEEQWDPASSEPPKDGKPEAENFPQDLHYDYQWDDERSYVEEAGPREEALPPPLFPWEFEPREVAERVFDSTVSPDTWGDLPLIKRIKALQLEEDTKKEVQPIARDLDELERLKEIEERYTGEIEEDVGEDAVEEGLIDVIEERDEEEIEELERLQHR
jgi:lipopolysaccharide biosynthesis glycosyltransferase